MSSQRDNDIWVPDTTEHRVPKEVKEVHQAVKVRKSILNQVRSKKKDG